MISNPTNENVRDKILELGYDLNSMKGVAGNYYTNNRLEDLKKLSLEIISERLA